MKRKKELYIVDDSEDHRFLVQNLFKKFLPQYPIRLFDGGEQLYHYLIQQSSSEFRGLLPGLIILDYKMPVISGYELLKLLRQTPDNENTQWKTLPVVMMTSEEVPQEVTKCYEAGANSFITKPVMFEELRSVMESICHYWLDYNRLPILKSIAG